jgi:hypothetical protein
MRLFFLIFIATYLIGLILIWIRPYTLVYDGSPSLIQQGLANSAFFLLLLTSYVAVLVRLCGNQLRNSEVVDSPYFLGFIFTLTSLVFSFHDLGNLQSIVENVKDDLGVNSNKVDVNVDAFLGAPATIISQAGIALTTSVIGIILRLFLASNYGSFDEESDIISDKNIKIIDTSYMVLYGFFCLIYVYLASIAVYEFFYRFLSPYFGWS